MTTPISSHRSTTHKAQRAERQLPLIENPPLLTVVVPVFNESGTIDTILRRVVSAPYIKQIIVVDDASTDATPDVLRGWQSHPQVQVLVHDHNRGKGAAIRTALEKARGRFTIVQDGDLEYNPQDYPRLIEPLLAGEADVVYGSRYLTHEGDRSSQRRAFRWGVGLLNVLVRWLYGARLTDEATCYKAFPTDVLRKMDLHCERFEFCPEVTAKACRLGMRIKEVPIRYDSRTLQAGKKIRFRDGLVAIATLWKWRRWQGLRNQLSTTRRPQGKAHT